MCPRAVYHDPSSPDMGLGPWMVRSGHAASVFLPSSFPASSNSSPKPKQAEEIPSNSAKTNCGLKWKWTEITKWYLNDIKALNSACEMRGPAWVRMMVNVEQMSVPLRCPGAHGVTVFNFNEALLHNLLLPLNCRWNDHQLNVQQNSSCGPQRNYLEIIALDHDRYTWVPWKSGMAATW